ncbi:M20/M25/M40 family metallo-hydrolase [Methylobacterium persicinum]
MRSTEPALLDRIEAALAQRVAEIEAARGVRFALGERTGSTPARMSSALIEALSGHARRLAIPFRTMASGAGHDTATLAGQGVPSTMIFIRNQNGSHNPHEAMRIEDLCAAATLVAHLVASE